MWNDVEQMGLTDDYVFEEMLEREALGPRLLELEESATTSKYICNARCRQRTAVTK